MSDILSQDEVDALLSAVSSEDFNSIEGSGSSQVSAISGAEKNVKLYDFRRPDRMHKDQMRTLQNIHEGFARQFSTTLTSYLRTLVEIDLLSVDQLTYSEFMMSVSSPSCIYLFEMEPLQGISLLDINPGLVFFMVDRLFGGQGNPTEQNRELTEIEKSVLNKIVERALLDLKEVWEHIGVFSPKVQGYETNPQFVQIVPPSESVILVSLEVRLKNGSGLVSICLPFLMLEAIVNKLSGESWISSQKTSTKEIKNQLQREISTTGVRLNAVLGDSKITLRDLLQLKRGDVVVLNKLSNSEILVKANGRDKFLGKMGVLGNNKCVQISGVIDREAGDTDE